MPTFLPGVPVERVLAALRRAGGNEVESGKLDSPESSAALAVNNFGWFIERPSDLPPLPTKIVIDWPAVSVDIEREMRFPWSGGRHPWLDTVIETGRHVIGVESKRFEPFRDAKTATFAEAYDRDVWGSGMTPFTSMRDRLRDTLRYTHLDAVQLVKHAFGLVTQARLCGKRPVLFYLYAEPEKRGGRLIDPVAIERHRSEVADFARHVEGAEVVFESSSYKRWFENFAGYTCSHATALIERFEP